MDTEDDGGKLSPEIEKLWLVLLDAASQFLKGKLTFGEFKELVRAQCEIRDNAHPKN